MQQCRLTREGQDAAKASYPEIFERRTQTNSGFAYPERGVNTFDVSEAERLETYETQWQAGGFAFWDGGYADLLLADGAKRTGYVLSAFQVPERWGATARDGGKRGREG